MIKPLRLFYVFPFFFSLGLGFAQSVYYVRNCHDGDTCELESSDKIRFKARLVGIDAPEVKSHSKFSKSSPGQSMGFESKKFLNDQIKRKQVTIKSYGVDVYRRNLVEILFEGKNINEELIKSGLAEVYKTPEKYKKNSSFDTSQFETLEQKAKKEKKGIWGLAHYESPSEYRKKQKK